MDSIKEGRYGSTAIAVDFKIYATDASFEDPLMCAHGVK
ncbi:Transcription initiation factor TFIID subunit like [Senna tora]|uniref:Transcription initiation factor TFIID subunit like n=1 Tax=Senna tora TaxID=362788 RepID=A0A834T0B3_9FABA|nr:Transcription initiation factor TFIID subunit like [Senna tora]